MFEVKTLQNPAEIEVNLPTSKSIINRALICAALAEGVSNLRNINLCSDVQVMINSLRVFGLEIKIEGKDLKITGGLELAKSAQITDLKNAGTTTRFLTALACLIEGENVLNDAQMRNRPMKPLIQALRECGAEIEGDELPLKIQGGSLVGGKLKIAATQSSQFISALLLCAPYFEQGLEIDLEGDLVSAPYIDMTIQVMQDFGVKVEKTPDGFKVLPQKYQAGEYEIEADTSAASYFEAINFLTDSKITFSNFPQDTLQADRGFATLLQDLRNGKKEFDLSNSPDLLPSLAVCAASLDQETKIINIGHTRFKESDRIHALATKLEKVGAKTQELPDALIIQGGDLHGAEIETYADHRIAMSFAALGTKVPGIKILDPDCVNKSYPGFWDEMKKVLSA